MSYGLLPEGFAAKPLEVAKSETESDWRSKFEESADLDPQTPDGNIITILTTLVSLLWNLLELVNAQFDPDQATGQNLVGLCALTGTLPLEATPSTVTATLTGAPGTVVAAGKVASVADTKARFATQAEATIAAVGAWAGTTVYAVGNRRSNGSSPARVYQVTAVTGTAHSAGSGGPTGTGTAITDNEVTWRYLGDGTGAVDVEADAEENGPTTCLSGTLTVIENPVAGWTSVTNVLDAELGRGEESDGNLRTRRELELRAGGNAAADAVRAKVLRVAGVTSCVVFPNDSDATDADGLPPHSFETLVEGGADADVAAAIWASKAAGIQTYGTSSAVTTDAGGASRTVYFTRPTLLNIYAALTLLVDGSPASAWPADGDEQVKAAVVAFGDAFPIGRDVTFSGVAAQAFRVPGVLQATPVYIGTAPSPASSATVTVGVRQRASFDSSRVTVSVSTGTP
jgi:uncharacterized phage protein gp47/JayE